MRIVILLENTTCRDDLAREHGLSLYIETGNTKILFDAGQTGAFADNAEKMGIDDVEIKFDGYRKSDPERRLLNTEKIRTRTTWTPIVTLDEGLTMCVNSIEK